MPGYDPYADLISNEVEELDTSQLENLSLPDVNQIEELIQPPEEEAATTEAVEAPVEEPQAPPEAPVTAQTGEIDHKQMWADMDAWRRLPDGPDKAALREEWTQKYHGKSWEQHQAAKSKGFLYSPEGAGSFYSMGGQFQERMSAAGQGLVDTTTDALNLIPGVNIPKVPEYQDSVAQATRMLAGLVLPQRLLRGAIASKAVGLKQAGVGSAWTQKLGNDRLFRFVSEAGLDIGTGVAVDYVAKQNQLDDNAIGALKKAWPKTWQFVPDTWATNDTDSPDIKRWKNVNEGAIFSVVGSLVEGLAKVSKAQGNIRAASEWLPENEVVGNKLETLTKDEFSDVKYSENAIEDTVLRNEARREKALDELGAYNLTEEPNPTKPVLGVHDTFEETESVIRTKDADGVLGASIDAARIQNDVDTTYGRLGSVVTEASLKNGLKADNLTSRALIRGLAEEIKSVGGKYGRKLASGKVVTEAEVEEAGLRLAALLRDPRMGPQEMLRMLEEFKRTTEEGYKVLGPKGYRGVTKTISALSQQFLDLDVEKARGYLTTSLAGQASDMAEGLRLMDDTTAIQRVQEQILDRLEYLMVEKGLAAYEHGASLRFLNTWRAAKDAGDTKKMTEAAAGFNAEVNDKLARIIPDTKNYIERIRQIAKERPEFLRPLMMAYEWSDGNINTIHRLNEFAKESTATWSKAFVDGKPEWPSILNRTQWSIIYNSVLSAGKTLLRAGYGNLGGLIARPLHLGYGYLREGDWKSLRRGIYQYTALGDSISRSFEHMKQVYRKAATDPTRVSYVVREDFALKEDDRIEVLRQLSKAHESEGNFGLTTILNIHEEQEALARHPWLRTGPNGMTALDGFSRSMLAVAESRGRAFDLLEAKYGDYNFFDNPWKEAELNKAADNIYRKMFDENGMIQDEAVDWANSEIALNQDSPLVRSMDGALKHVPGLKPFFMFPRTSANVITLFGKYNPASRWAPSQRFASDYMKFVSKPLAEMPIEEVHALLRSRGMPVDEFAVQRFKDARAEIRGRVATGTMAVVGAGFLLTQNRITGNGHWDPQKQRLRTEADWPRKSVQGFDGKWYSYEHLGPVGDWLAMVVDVGDNFDSISESAVENTLKKLAFIFGASLSNKSMMSNVEPLLDVLSGNGAAANKWGATFANNMLPLAGARNEIGRLMYPQLRELDMEMLQIIRNKNAWLDPLDKLHQLPNKHDWVDGGLVKHTDNWWVRSWNHFGPFKISENPTKEKQFLINIGYDSKPHVNTTTTGVKLKHTERAMLYSLIGEHGHFKRELKKIMKYADKLVDPRNPNIKGFENILRAARQGFIPSTILNTSEFQLVFQKIDQALIEAKGLAEANLPEDMRNSIDQRLMQEKALSDANKRGDVDEILKIGNPK